jgi:hypothetical protein
VSFGVVSSILESSESFLFAINDFLKTPGFLKLYPSADAELELFHNEYDLLKERLAGATSSSYAEILEQIEEFKKHFDDSKLYINYCKFKNVYEIRRKKNTKDIITDDLLTEGKSEDPILKGFIVHFLFCTDNFYQ